MALPPGPAQPAAWQALRWIVRPEAALLDAHARLGDVFTLQLPFGKRVIVADPDAIKAIFTGDPDVFRAGEGNAPLEPVVGPSSILLLDGPAHLRQRRLLLPSFHGERLARWTALMGQIARADVERWPRDRPLRLEDRTRAITLEVILRVVFGIDEAARLEELRALFRRLVPAGAGRMIALLPPFRRDLGPLTPWRRFLETRARIDAILHDEIARRRADPGLAERDDVLSLLAATELTDRELRDELMTLLLAGHETTAVALAWTFALLFADPPAHARVVAAVRDDDVAAGDALLDSLIAETLRLRPPLPAVVRRLSRPATVAGYELPAGTSVAPSIWLVHRRADLYPEPHDFRPERFLRRAPETYSWLPFGGGIRRCVGATFAQTEMRVVLRALLERVDLAPAGPPITRSQRRAIVLAPPGGTPALVTR
ncbi:MAG TPA: cytochrome P450 [Capillimicrobium sp.]|nr:cytochrome P450 [Capillimicrobium sp.]